MRTPYIGQMLKESRQKTGYTQPEAAARLPIERRTLQRYEQNEQECPDEMAPIFADAYGDPQLMYRALQASPLWKSIMPQFDGASLPEATLSMLLSLSRLERQQEALMEIASDGRITDDEATQWATVASTAKRTIIACLQVLEAAERRAIR